MKLGNLLVPSGYVASGVEVVLSLIMFVCLSVASIVLFRNIKEIPDFPERLVLENAYIFSEVSQSRSTSYLYLRVGLEEPTYDYVIEAFSRDVRHLDLSRSRNLLVAVDSVRDKQFIWAVYDNDGVSLINSEDLLVWAKHYNSWLYFLILVWLVISLFFLWVVIWHGVWSRMALRRHAHEDRAD